MDSHDDEFSIIRSFHLKGFVALKRVQTFLGCLSYLDSLQLYIEYGQNSWEIDVTNHIRVATEINNEIGCSTFFSVKKLISS